MTTKYIGEGGSFKRLTAESNLIAKYTHTANTVIQPTALDVTTGIFTTGVVHGLSVGDTIYFNFNDWTIGGVLPITKAPYELFLSGASGQVNTTCCVHVVNTVPTTTTFTLRNASNTDLLFNTNGTVNSGVDVTAFHFEKLVAFTLSNINRPKLRMRLMGITPPGFGGISFESFECRFNPANAMNYIVTDIIFEPVLNMLQGYIQGVVGTAIRANGTTGNYNFAISYQANPSNFFSSTSGNNVRMSSTAISSFQFNSVRSTWLNGTTVEVYDLT